MGNQTSFKRPFKEYDEGKLYTVQGRNPVTCLFQNQEMPLLKMMLIFRLHVFHLPFFSSVKKMFMLAIYLWHMYWSLWQVRKNIAKRTKFVLFYAYKEK